MSDDKYFIADEDSAYGEGILVDEYHGAYSIVAARQSKEGETYMQWCFPQKRDGSKGPIEKSVPWKINLGGSKTEAAHKLRELALRIEGGGEEVPF